MKTIRVLGAAVLSLGCVFTGCSAETGAPEEVGQSQAALIGQDTFLYFRSNASGWGVDDSTRLVTNLGGAFFKKINVSEPWMVSGFDTATVTETNQVNGWGSSQTFYDLQSTQTLVAGSAPQALVVSPPGGDPHFQVDYAVLGAHQVLVNTSTTPFQISVRSEADVCGGVGCPSRSHCALGVNGLPTCVGDTPVCGGVECPAFSICCNSGCSNAFCFGGSGACPPVPCQ